MPANNQGRVAPAAPGPGAVSKKAQKPANANEPLVKSDKPKPAAKSADAAKSARDPYAFWPEYFAKTPFKTPADGEAFLYQTVSEMFKAGKIDHAEAAILGYLRSNNKDAQPLMYEMLIKCVESRKGLFGKTPEENEAEVRRYIGYAAHLARKSKNPTDLVRVADMMILRGHYGPVGDPGYRVSPGEMVDLAAEQIPGNAIPPMMSLKIAVHDKDPKRMGDAAERLLSLGWPGFDDRVRGDVKEQVKQFADALRSDGKNDEAEGLMARLADSESRDLFIRLTWKGKADIDMSVAEPYGATAGFHNPRTVFGGALVKNGYGSHPEEVYVCPRAFDGSYTIVVEKIVDDDPAKPVLEATMEVILHEGAADEQRETHAINVAKPEPVVVKLTGGRRKTVLPFIAPPPAPPAVAGPKPKDIKKNEAAPAAPRPNPFQ